MRRFSLLFILIILNGISSFKNGSSFDFQFVTREVKFNHKNESDVRVLNQSLIILNDKNVSITENNQIWYLSGGPGLNGASVLSLAQKLIQTYKSPHIAIIPDHRGTGNSSYVNCPVESDIDSCIKYVKNNLSEVSPYYTIDQSSYDIIDAMKKYKTSGKITLYGINYGTLVVNRLLQLLKNDKEIKIHNVILDGLIPPDIVEYELQSFHLNNIGYQILSDCSRVSQTCEKVFGRSPDFILNGLWNKFLHGNTSCISKLKMPDISLNKLRGKWTKSLLNDEEVFLIPGIFKRLERCSVNDIKELEFWYKNFKPKYIDEKNNFIYRHIKYSELYSISTPKNITDELFLFTESLNEFSYHYYDWPKYEVDVGVYRKWANNFGSVLLIHGEYDPLSNLMYSIYAKDEIEKNNGKVQFVRVPFNYNKSPSTKEKRPDCVNEIIHQFLLDNKQISLKCLDDLSMDFEGDNEGTKKLSKEAFGVEEIWGDEEKTPQSGVPDSMTWEGYVLFGTFIALVIIVSAVFILLVVKSTKRPDQTRGANNYFQHD